MAKRPSLADSVKQAAGAEEKKVKKVETVEKVKPVKVTFELEPALYSQLRYYALDEDKSIREILTEQIRNCLARAPVKHATRR